MSFRTSLALLVLGAATWLSACAGGSGSSGFDINAASEAVTIQRVLDDGECRERNRLTICRADEGGTPIPATPQPGSSPTPSAAPRVDTQLDSSAALACVPLADAGSCRLTVRFTTAGFAPGSTFHIAARSTEEGAAWSIHTTAEAGNDERSALVQVPLQGLEIQIAILVFAGTPSSVPSTIRELADSGADFAYVTQTLMLTPS